MELLLTLPDHKKAFIKMAPQFYIIDWAELKHEEKIKQHIYNNNNYKRNKHLKQSLCH